MVDDSYPLTPVDVRRKRPPLLSFLLRAETLRNVVRVVTLLALDFAGVFAAIFTALMLKAYSATTSAPGGSPSRRRRA